MIKPLKKIFKLSYRPAERKNILTENIKKTADEKIELFLKEN